MSNTGLNEEAWKKLFKKYDILQHIEDDGYFNISAIQIKEFREPRLMTKFDHSVNLPMLFLENNLSILPITRGDYVISHFDAYHKFEPYISDIINNSIPKYIQSLDSKNISSEAIALNCAFVSGIIADFLEDTEIVPTVSGRMGSGKFSFTINDIKTRDSHLIDVENSQIEIDAAYEGLNYLALFEAKRDLSEDFLVRQLYYPFRVWKDKVTKPVKPVFLVYSNGIYRLYEYMFEHYDNYNSLKLVKQKHYSVWDTTISSLDIQEILQNTAIVKEPDLPFPQANKFERIINLCELLTVRDLSRSDVTGQYDFDIRQTNYYTDAALYLGLLNKKEDGGEPFYSISTNGKKILDLDLKQRQLEFCKIILSHKAFNMTLQKYFQKGEMPEIEEIVYIMKQSDLYNVQSEKTFIRRASTIKVWINWIVSLIND